VSAQLVPLLAPVQVFAVRAEARPDPLEAFAACAMGALQERHDAMSGVCENALAAGQRMAASLAAVLAERDALAARLAAAEAEIRALAARLGAGGAAGGAAADVVVLSDSDSDAGAAGARKRRRAGGGGVLEALRRAGREAYSEAYSEAAGGAAGEAGGEAGSEAGSEAASEAGSEAASEAGSAGGAAGGSAGAGSDEAEARGPRGRLTSLARAGGAAGPARAPAPRMRLAALSGPRHTLLTGDVSRVLLARPDGYMLRQAELALCLPWDADLWHRKQTRWRPFAFNMTDQRVVYYDARDVDAGRPVVPLLEEELKALIARELRPIPVAEYIERGPRAARTRGAPALRLYKQVFPGARAAGYQEVDVLRATTWIDAGAAPVKARLATVTLRFSQLARAALDLTLDVRRLARLAGDAGCPLYVGLWSAPSSAGGGGASGTVPDAARWGEGDAEVRRRYMLRVEKRVLFDERVLQQDGA